MNLRLTQNHHEVSPAFSGLITRRLESLASRLQIDEARVLVERRPEASPAFRITAQLVTPGPDLFAEGVDHTLRAALEKMMEQLEDGLDHRRQKQTQRASAPPRKTSPARRPPATARK